MVPWGSVLWDSGLRFHGTAIRVAHHELLDSIRTAGNLISGRAESGVVRWDIGRYDGMGWMLVATAIRVGLDGSRWGIDGIQGWGMISGSICSFLLILARVVCTHSVRAYWESVSSRADLFGTSIRTFQATGSFEVGDMIGFDRLGCLHT